MNRIRISLDNMRFEKKPTSKQAAVISSRIAEKITVLTDENDMAKFISIVGCGGCTFSPATFVNGIRRKENFEQMQMLVLDFDGTISYQDVLSRADDYELPILAIYETFTSNKQDRFRVLFLNDTSITDIESAKIIKNALLMIFPETDKTDSDIAKMYYGGKKVLYFNPIIETIDLETVLRNMSCYLVDKYGSTHYKKYIRKYAESNKIRLNKKGDLDIIEIKDVTDGIKNGKNSPSTIIYSKSNGGFLPSNYYQLYLTSQDTYPCSVDKNQTKNHKVYRSYELKNIVKKCKLYSEFNAGIRKLNHNELFGIASNLVNVETGIKIFKDVLEKYPDYYSADKRKKWKSHLRFIKDNNYSCMSCDKYCPYCNKCQHGSNILATVKVKRGTMVRLANYYEEYYPLEEVEQDLEKLLKNAVDADDVMYYIIKAQTSIGKTESYLKIMKLSGKRFLIVVPTNKLKHDVERRAKEMGIDVMVTPSLDELENEIPSEIWNHIKFLRSIGQHSQMHSYIKRVAIEEDVKCLQKYLRKMDKIEKHSGNVITTHRKLLTMNERTLNKYDVVIIDEDIISSSIVTNQCEIPFSILKKILKKVTKKLEAGSTSISYQKLAIKIRKLLKTSKEHKHIKLPQFEWDTEGEEIEEDDILVLADIPSFCLSEHYIHRKASEETNLTEDSIVFLKPWNLKKKKYIMVSATVDKDICEYCFGKHNVKFNECKQTKYAGTLNQYYQKSMSRNVIDGTPDLLKKIREWSGFEHMITFKKYSDGNEMYFGNAIGCDYLKGQNIDIVGTPYQVDFIYKLLPVSLGIPIDEEAVMKPHLVMHNGYSFMFTTYGEDDDILRKFHFWLIESELEQAVGRARLLRCNCTVNLFSNFPLRQAKMKEYEFENV